MLEAPEGGASFLSIAPGVLAKLRLDGLGNKQAVHHSWTLTMEVKLDELPQTRMSLLQCRADPQHLSSSLEAFIHPSGAIGKQHTRLLRAPWSLECAHLISFSLLSRPCPLSPTCRELQRRGHGREAVAQAGQVDTGHAQVRQRRTVRGRLVAAPLPRLRPKRRGPCGGQGWGGVRGGSSHFLCLCGRAAGLREPEGKVKPRPHQEG